MPKYKPISTLAMILAGGRVDELNVLTHYRPKSAVPFGGVYRIIDFALSNLMHSGLELVAILSQFRSFSLINHIGIGAAWDMMGRYRGVFILPPSPSSDYVSTSWYKGPVDAVFRNIDFIEYHQPEEVLILSGDHVYQMDYRPLINYHRQKGADLTMSCVWVPLEEAHRFGVADVDDEDGEFGGRVVNYQEKPDSAECNWASLTLYCFNPKVLIEMLQENAAADISHEFGRSIIPSMMAKGYRVYGHKFTGYWGYTRTIREYWQTNMDLLVPDSPIDLEAWGIRTNLEHRDIRDCQPLKTGPSASISNSLIYNGCLVEGEVENSILFPGAHIKPNARVKDSILFFDNVIGERARIDKVISDVNNTIGRNAVIGSPFPKNGSEITTIGWNNYIPAGSRIGSDCTIYPKLGQEKFSQEIKRGETIR
ncbi:MAG: sugar phosphate nucleotidyltransferase [Thermodesulfobacteriota bacterium]